MLAPALTALLVTTVAQNAPSLMTPRGEPPPQGVSSFQRLTVRSAELDATSTGAVLTSRFSEWYPAAREVVRTVRTACKRSSSLGGWCGRYWGPQATTFDVRPLIESEGLAVASFLAAQPAILGAFAALDPAAVDSAATAALTEEQRGDKTARQASLRKLESQVAIAAGTGLVANAGIGQALGLALPGIDLGAQAQKILEGIAAAMQERAEQEAVLYALEVFDQEVCTTVVKPFLWNTCTLADSGAFSGTVAAGGAASIELLRNALEADARALPGVFGRNVVEHAYDADPQWLPSSTRSANAEAVGALLDDLVRGAWPERALDSFSFALSTGLDPEAPVTSATDGQRAMLLARCGAALPAALSRSGAQVASTYPLSRNDRGLAIALLTLEGSRCAWLYEQVWGKGFEGHPFQGGEGRLRLWARYADGLAAVGQDFNDVERSLALARASAEGALEKAREKNDPAAVARAIADSVFASLDAADAAARLASQLVVLATPDGGRPPADAARIKASIDALAVALRRVRSYGDVVYAAAARDHGRTFQAALRVSRYGDGGALGMPVPKDLQRSLGLVVAIVDAKDPTEVKNALLAAAAPAGSWRLKYASKEGKGGRGAVTLGGLVGFGPSVAKEVGWSPRLMMPVGVDVVPYAWQHMNFSLFFQLLDVAGYANQGDRRPRVLQGVVPGASLKIPIWKSPFAAFAGATYSLDDGQELARPAWRFNAGLAVDVSLFVLNKP